MADPWGTSWLSSWGENWKGTIAPGTPIDPWGGSWGDTWGGSWSYTTVTSPSGGDYYVVCFRRRRR